MSLKARINRLLESFGRGKLWDGANMGHLVIHGYLNHGKPHNSGPIPHGVQRMVTFACILSVLNALRQPARIRAELEETRKTDVFRKEQGWQLALRDGREQWFIDRISEADADALETLAELGLAEDYTPEALAEKLLELGRESGFTPPEMEKIEHLVNPPVGAVRG